MQALGQLQGLTKLCIIADTVIDEGDGNDDWGLGELGVSDLSPLTRLSTLILTGQTRLMGLPPSMSNLNRFASMAPQICLDQVFVCAACNVC